MAGLIRGIQNILGITPNGGKSDAFITTGGGSTSPVRNLTNRTIPLSFVRAKIDLQSWSSAIMEAEQASFPYRVAMQNMYEKTKLNAHVAACIQRRKELTLLRDFQIENANGEYDKYWTEYFKQAWYKQVMLELILDAQYFGYSLISIGGFKNGVPDEIINIKRWNISPDRKHVSILPRSPSGWSFDTGESAKWHIWVPTLQTNGINNCGYGYLYPVAALEILQRNNVQYNTDFIEMFAQPLRVLKTNDLEGEEFEAKKAYLEGMGHSAAMIMGLTDELELLNDGSRGNGYKAYNDFDHRAKGDISKLIGGHADFIDSTTKNPGMGSQNSGAGDVTDDATGNTQVQKAIAAKRMIDGDFATTVTNYNVIPKLRKLGVLIPEGHKIHFLNDSEERSIASQEADKNQKIATLALSFAQAGLQMDAAYATKATNGIPFTRVEISPDKNVVKDKKQQAAGKGTLKDESKKRTDKPKHTN